MQPMHSTLDSGTQEARHRKFSPMDRMNLGRVSLGRMYQNGPSNGNGLAKKYNAEQERQQSIHPSAAPRARNFT
jgi:hypothetical protein